MEYTFKNFETNLYNLDTLFRGMSQSFAPLSVTTRHHRFMWKHDSRTPRRYLVLIRGDFYTCCKFKDRWRG